MSNSILEAQQNDIKAAKKIAELQTQLEHVELELKKSVNKAESLIKERIDNAINHQKSSIEAFKEIITKLPHGILNVLISDPNAISKINSFTINDLFVLTNLDNLEQSNYTSHLIDSLNTKISPLSVISTEIGELKLVDKNLTSTVQENSSNTENHSSVETDENEESEGKNNIEKSNDANTVENNSNVKDQTIDFNNKENYIDIEVKPKNLPREYNVVRRRIYYRERRRAIERVNWLYTIVGPKLDLSGANLRGAKLYGANLQEANLQGADLREADLRLADLRGASLQGADLVDADLENADLENAYLEEANLTRANLTYAYASGANFTDAILYDANFKETNLTGATLNKISNIKNLKLEEIPLKFTLNGIEYTQSIKEKELINLIIGTSYSNRDDIPRTLLYNINNPLTSTEIAILTGLEKSQYGIPSTFVKGKFRELLNERYAELKIIPKTKGNYQKIYLTLKEEFYRRLISEGTTNENIIAES